MVSFRALVAALLVFAAAPAAAQDADVAALARAYPDSAALLRRQLAIALETGDAATAHATMERLAALGFALSEPTQERLQSVIGASAAAKFKPRFAANRFVHVASNVVATVPVQWPLIEGVAWDSKHSRLFVTSVVGRALLYRTDKGWTEVQGLDAGSLSGVAIDASRNLLWVASGATERTPGRETAFNGLIAIDLDTLKVKQRVPMPGRGWPGDIAVGPQSTVYVADPMRGAIYQLPAWSKRMMVLVPEGRLANPQGMVAIDRERLYVADYIHGPVVVTFQGGAVVTPLASDAGTMLDGIDGLLPWRKGLVAIQNGTQPNRILYLALDTTGTRITRADVLEAGNPAWGEPTLGAIRTGELLYIDGQGLRYGDGGKVVGKEPVPPTAIRALSLLGTGG